VDKNRAYPAAVAELKMEGTLRRRCRLSQSKYLNNVVEQDHRVSKKRVWLARGYQSFSTAWRTLQGIEAVHMIRKGRARWVGKGDPLAQLQFIDTLFGLAIWRWPSAECRRSRALEFSQRYPEYTPDRENDWPRSPPFPFLVARLDTGFARVLDAVGERPGRSWTSSLQQALELVGITAFDEETVRVVSSR